MPGGHPSLPVLPELGPFIAYNYVPAVPSDTAPQQFTALYIGVSGDVTVEALNAPSVPVTFKSVPLGFFPVAGGMLMATGTTATNIVLLS